MVMKFKIILIALLLVVPVIAEDWNYLEDTGVESYTIGETVDLSVTFTNPVSEENTYTMEIHIQNPSPSIPIPSSTLYILNLQADEEISIPNGYTVGETDSQGMYTYRATVKDNQDDVVYEYEKSFEIYGTLSVFHNAYTVAYKLCLGKLMRRQEYSFILCSQIFKNIADVNSAKRIQARKRFIEYKKLGVMQKSLCYI